MSGPSILIFMISTLSASGRFWPSYGLKPRLQRKCSGDCSGFFAIKGKINASSLPFFSDCSDCSGHKREKTKNGHFNPPGGGFGLSVDIPGGRSHAPRGQIAGKCVFSLFPPLQSLQSLQLLKKGYFLRFSVVCFGKNPLQSPLHFRCTQVRTP
jgi:hypothetical protein